MLMKVKGKTHTFLFQALADLWEASIFTLRFLISSKPILATSNELLPAPSIVQCNYGYHMCIYDWGACAKG